VLSNKQVPRTPLIRRMHNIVCGNLPEAGMSKHIAASCFKMLCEKILGAACTQNLTMFRLKIYNIAKP
jgi:hypothetical protein